MARIKHGCTADPEASAPVDSDCCQRCGSDTEHVDCWQCGGEGATLPGDLYDEDPLWYAPNDTEPCHICGGSGGWMLCVNRCDEKVSGTNSSKEGA